MPLYQFILKRLLYAIPTLIIISIISFTLMRFDIEIGPYKFKDPFSGSAYTLYTHLKNPIDPLANLRNNPQIPKEVIQKEEQRLGLKLPLYQQYWQWVSHIFQWNAEAFRRGNLLDTFQPDLGKTHAGEEVAWLIMERAKNTLLLNVVALLLTWLIAIPLGVYAAVHWRSKVDRALTLLTTMGMASPSFVIAILGAVFVVKTGILPLGGLRSTDFEHLNPLAQGWDIFLHLLLPALIMCVLGIASLQRQMRGNLLDVLGAEYIRTAYAKGLAQNVVLYKHAVRNALNPLITMLGYEVAGLLSGSMIVETVLDFPGIGQLMFNAAIQGDTNLVMANLVMASGLLLLGNLFADILLKVADPRVELQ